MLAPEEYQERPSPPRVEWSWLSGIGPDFVHLSIGVRLVFGGDPFRDHNVIAVHLGLVFGELMIQWNGRASEEG